MLTGVWRTVARYLIKTYNDTILKLFKYIPMFNEKARKNFARTLGFILADPQQQIVNPAVLQGLLADHIVKDGASENPCSSLFFSFFLVSSSFFLLLRQSPLPLPFSLCIVLFSLRSAGSPVPILDPPVSIPACESG